MPKTDAQFDPAEYAPVADRIALFWRQHPSGRILTELVSRTESEVVFRALVFRSAEEREPAATGWAAEREGDGAVNTVACLENTETSAIGRALANLGFTAARQRPSAEEMAKAARARSRPGREASGAPPVRVVSPARVAEGGRGVPAASSHAHRAADPYQLDEPLQRRANLVLDLLRLIAAAERAGLRPARAARWRALLASTPPSDVQAAGWERRLRAWVRRR